MKTYIAAKIHGIRVTDKSVQYSGSVSICPALMAAAGIEPYEQVHIINLHNGARWITYALPAKTGVFTLNGGGARLGEVGDECVVMTYESTTRYTPATVIFCSPNNMIRDRLSYENP